jgi:hypothetical protein
VSFVILSGLLNQWVCVDPESHEAFDRADDQGETLPRARRAALTARSTSSALVCQLQTETRIQRIPRQVVPPKKASSASPS